MLTIILVSCVIVVLLIILLIRRRKLLAAAPVIENLPKPDNARFEESATALNNARFEGTTMYDTLYAEMMMDVPPNPDPDQYPKYSKFKKYLENNILINGDINKSIMDINSRILQFDEFDTNSDKSEIYRNNEYISYIAEYSISKFKFTVRLKTRYTIASKIDDNKLHVIMRLHTNYATGNDKLGKRNIISYISIIINKNGVNISNMQSNMYAIFNPNNSILSFANKYVDAILEYIKQDLTTIFNKIIT